MYWTRTKYATLKAGAHRISRASRAVPMHVLKKSGIVLDRFAPKLPLGESQTNGQADRQTNRKHYPLLAGRGIIYESKGLWGRILKNTENKIIKNTVCRIPLEWDMVSKSETSCIWFVCGRVPVRWCSLESALAWEPPPTRTCCVSPSWSLPLPADAYNHSCI